MQIDQYLIDLFFVLSPQGLKFRSRASLHAFLLDNEEGNLDINLFDFTASKGSDVTTPTKVKLRRRKKKHADGQQEDVTEGLDPPPNKSKRASSSLRSTKEVKVKCSKDSNGINQDSVEGELSHVIGVKAAPSTSVDDVILQKSPQRVGQLREKLLRLAPSSSQQNTLTAHEDKQADSQPSLPTLSVEPATESENEGEDEQSRHQIRILSEGDNKPNSVLEAVADSYQHVEEEVLLPDISGGSCAPARESQNSKYDLHRLTTCESIS